MLQRADVTVSSQPLETGFSTISNPTFKQAALKETLAAGRHNGPYLQGQSRVRISNLHS